jgi:L-ascorbate metabolism protein UlaG (beta-lactamase superfamily)
MAGRSNSKKFKNMHAVKQTFDGGGLWSMIRDSLKRDHQRKPAQALEPVKFDATAWANLDEDAYAWFGHSSYMLKVAGKTVLVDPVLAMSYMPVRGLGGRRYQARVPLTVDEVPAVDVLLITHNHYDHLNRPTIQAIHGRVKHIVTSVGVAPLLRRWGVPADKITELAWWEAIDFAEFGIRITGTPAQHFSGRGLFDRDASHWNSYVLEAGERRVYCGGDSGYGPHFREIGERFGPFDVTLLDTGQYDDRWRVVHMNPEDSVQAHLDLRGKQYVPVHWGAFTLAFHDWNDPAVRATAAAEARGVAVTIPRVGEIVRLADMPYIGGSPAWWTL